MNKHIQAFFCAVFLNCLDASIALATPSPALMQELNTQVLRVQVIHNNGSHGLGSAVVISKDHVVTNCHVVTEAHHVEVILNGVSHIATEVKPDWHHDLCILTVTDLNAPSAKMGETKSLKYEASVFTVGFPDKTTQPVNTFGVVKEMFPMDGSVVIRATSPFRLGASGGGVFDESGSLVGIITLKSRGNRAYYYYMPVEWVQTLMQKPAQALSVKSEKPFWALNDMQKPYFMQVVQPYVSKDWKSLLAVTEKWVSTEPNTAESWFYLAMAEYETNAYDKSLEHLNKVLSLKADHAQAIAYLNKITEKTISAQPASSQVAYLTK